MRRLIILASLIAAMTACTPVRMAGSAAVTAGQTALGAADLVL